MRSYRRYSVWCRCRREAMPPHCAFYVLRLCDTYEHAVLNCLSLAELTTSYDSRRLRARWNDLAEPHYIKTAVACQSVFGHSIYRNSRFEYDNPPWGRRVGSRSTRGYRCLRTNRARSRRPFRDSAPRCRPLGMSKGRLVPRESDSITGTPSLSGLRPDAPISVV
ncbi:hypothetical protein OH76DRAFT_631743 [Lentinus brumalis]|uniref:Uncharacterized protein n=1 Tax=Lentinus brumalis TaxID=2498619 RepID=A0A371D8H6_9APHY|nr:hypothetical protein OH76DRAFT_631743 [Polyporus brumalis]